MKNKSSKRSASNKHSHRRSYKTHTRCLSTPNEYPRTISPNMIDKIDLGTGTVLLDPHVSCLKPNVPIKSQKQLKRDLLRCSNQRPSFLSPQTLQAPRIHRASQQTHSGTSSSTSSSLGHQNSQRRRSSLPISIIFHSTTDRIGPWTDLSISGLPSNGNDLLRPLKTFRNIKNPHLFSLKYYSSLTDKTSQFKWHLSIHNYIEEYRKQKGYVLDLYSAPQSTSLSLSSSIPLGQLINEHLSTAENTTTRDQTSMSVTTLSSTARGTTKSADDVSNNTNRLPTISSTANPMNTFPSIPYRHKDNFRSNRRSHNHTTVALPTVKPSSVPYFNSLNSVGKSCDDNKKTSTQNQSRFFVIDGRKKKRYLIVGFFFLSQLKKKDSIFLI